MRPTITQWCSIIIAISAHALLSGCAELPWSNGAHVTPAGENTPHPVALPPLVTKTFFNIASSTEILGEIQVVNAHERNTFSDIARQYNLGYSELKIANPDVDPWLPGSNTPVFLPTMFILPRSARDGIVINLPSMRLVRFENSANADSHLLIENYPIGIGREGWATPTGTFHITEKTRDPNWYPPASVRAEHRELNDPLPAIVPPGPDNPLGRFKMRLSEPDYLIHGTNKPSGVGMRISHGCIRLFPEDIAVLFDGAPTNTKVSIVNQPVLAGWRNGQLYLEVHPPLAEDTRPLASLAQQAIDQALADKQTSPTLNEAAIHKVLTEQRGIPFPISTPTNTFEGFLALARLVENIVPVEGIKETASR